MKVAVILVACLLAGCVSNSDADDGDPIIPDTSESFVRAPNATSENWSALEIAGTLPGGSWVVFIHPVTTDIDLPLEYVLNAAAGSASGVMAIGPLFVSRDDENTTSADEFFSNSYVRLDPFGGAITHEPFTDRISQPIRGEPEYILYAAAALTDWDFTIRIENPKKNGPVVRPDVIHEGSGFTMSRVADATAMTPYGPDYELAYRSQIAAGFQAVSVQTEGTLPTNEQRQEDWIVSLPDGTSRTSAGFGFHYSVDGKEGPLDVAASYTGFGATRYIAVGQIPSPSLGINIDHRVHWDS